MNATTMSRWCWCEAFSRLRRREMNIFPSSLSLSLSSITDNPTRAPPAGLDNAWRACNVHTHLVVKSERLTGDIARLFLVSHNAIRGIDSDGFRRHFHKSRVVSATSRVASSPPFIGTPRRSRDGRGPPSIGCSASGAGESV